MKLTTTAIVAMLMACSAPISFAQGNDQRGPGGQQGGQEGRHRPPPPIIAALDLNHDGILTKDEIAKASESLKTLDKNGDGQLTQDELRPPRPEDSRGPQGQGGPNQGPPPPNGGRP
jgi:hypothetical protein